MSDRGEYRAVRRVLLDGPDFQQQSRDARWVFVALKLNFGPAGIEVWYPAELTARLSAQTGVSVAGVQEALLSLERGGWIQREANVVWIVEQLKHDPHVTPANPKHRTMVEHHLDGLPRLGIVHRFVQAYAHWFTANGKPDGEPTPRLRYALDTVSDTVSNPSRSTENKPENKPEDNLGSSADAPRVPRPSGEYPPEFVALWSVYPARSGGNSKKDAYHAWRARLRAGVPCEVMQAGAERYRAYCEAEGNIGTRYVMQGSTFLGTGDQYLEPWTASVAVSKPAEKAIAVVDGWFAA